MITFKFLRFPFVVCVPHTVNELVTDIILNITSQEDLMLTLLHIGSRLFELFSKEVRVKKQPGRPLNILYLFPYFRTKRSALFVIYRDKNISHERRFNKLSIDVSFLIFGKKIKILRSDETNHLRSERRRENYTVFCTQNKWWYELSKNQTFW